MNTIATLCGYIIVILFALYTLFCFTAFRGKNKSRQNRIFGQQRVCIFAIQLICHFLLYIKDQDFRIIILYAVQVVAYFAAIHIYQIFYKGLSKLVLNNMIMLIMISIIMLERIRFDDAVRQFAVAAVGMAACVLVPIIIKKFTYMDRLGWQYALLGVILLVVVLLFGKEKYGAKNWLNIAGVEFQPSEIVKLLYVFFIAALLAVKTNFKRVVIVSAAAGAHVLVLVAEKDLGGALIFFITYIIMLYVATRNPGYLCLGLGGGSAAAVLAYNVFAHIRVRVSAWQDPWSVIDDDGFQVAQSLFAIGMGGWFGLGLGRGAPKSIPVVESDFIFALISEELGGIFALCLLMVYLSCFIMFINIAMKIKKQFYKLTALGLAVMFIFQIFVAIGGVTKFIPSTGVTLPLVSYGGSSVLSTLLLFSIIQGMYVLNGSEEVQNEEIQQKDS